MHGSRKASSTRTCARNPICAEPLCVGSGPSHRGPRPQACAHARNDLKLCAKSVRACTWPCRHPEAPPDLLTFMLAATAHKILSPSHGAVPFRAFSSKTGSSTRVAFAGSTTNFSFTSSVVRWPGGCMPPPRSSCCCHLMLAFTAQLNAHSSLVA